MKHALQFFVLCLFLICSSLVIVNDAEAQVIKDPEVISNFLDTLELTDEERRFLQHFYETYGLRTQKIVGGDDADIEDYPWHVAITTAAGSQYCGGTIIHEEWILTAAHCMGGNPHIRAGVTNRTDTSGQDRGNQAVYNHPDFVPSTLEYDAALIKLDSPLDLSDPNVAAIPISTMAHHLQGYEDPDVMSTITGWGALFSGGPSPDILQVAQVPIVSNEQAAEGYPGYVVSDDMLAAGFWGEGGVDACQGDSGGPLVVPAENDMGGVVAGITSWGVGCAGAYHMGMYGRVSWFEDWIEDTAGLTFPPPGEDDGVPPASITDLEIEGMPTENSLTITWTAPGSSGNEGRAASYDARFSTSPITSDNFEDADPIEGFFNPSHAGTSETFTVSDLDPLTTYYFAIKTEDFFGNISDISNVASGETDGSPEISVSSTEFSAELEYGETEVQTMTITNTGEGLLTFNFPAFSQNQPLTNELAQPLKSTADFASTASDRRIAEERRVYQDYLEGRIPNLSSAQQRIVDRFQQQAQSADTVVEPQDNGDSVLLEFEELTASGGEFFDVTGDGYLGDLVSVTADFVIDNAGGQTWASDFAVLFTTEPEINSNTVVLQVGGYTNYAPNGTRVEWGTGGSGNSGTPVNTTVSIPSPVDVQDLYVWIGHGWDSGSSSTWSGSIELNGISDVPAFISDVSPASGQIPVGENTEISFTLDASSLPVGEHEGLVLLRSNDLVTPSIPLEFFLEITGEGPLLHASPSELDFGSVFAGTDKSLNVTITNNGTSLATIDEISISDTAFEVDSTDGFELEPGASHELEVTFNPESMDSYSGVLTLNGTDGTDDLEIVLTGEGTGTPELALDPDELEITVPEGGSDQLTLEISNNGNGPLHYSFPDFMSKPDSDNSDLSEENSRETGLMNADFLSIEPVEGTVEAGQSAQIIVSFDADGFDPGAYESTIELHTNDPDAEEVTIPVTMTVEEMVGLIASPGSLNFGTTYIGLPKTIDVKFSNNSDETISVESMTFDHDALSSDFEPFEVESGSEVIVAVTFDPDSEGPLSASVAIEHDGPNDTLTMNASGNAAHAGIVSADPDEVDATVGTGIDTPVSFTIHNSGGIGLEFSLDAHYESNAQEAGFSVSFTPSEGSIDSGESKEMIAVINTGELEPGEFSFEILVSTDSPATPETVIPVNLEIIDAADLSEMVTFSVDMNVMMAEGFFVPENDQVFVRGTFTDWDYDAEDAMQLTDNGVYEITLEVQGEPGKEHEFKFFIDSENAEEIPNSGWEIDGVGENGATNRILVMTGSDQELPVVYFNNSTDVGTEGEDEVPVDFALLQNYPNPFNPTTNITFELPEPEHVRLEIFNIQGQRVAELVNSSHQAGSHTVVFDASRLASGLYIYRLQAGGFVQTKKMMLVK